MRTTIALALLAGLIGCSSDSTTSADTAYLGSYTLISVNSQSVPAVIAQTPTEKDEIVSGTLTLNANATFAAVLSYRQTISGNVTTVPFAITGTWTRSGNSFELKDTTGQTSTATFSNNQLTASITSPLAVTLLFKHD